MGTKRLTSLANLAVNAGPPPAASPQRSVRPKHVNKLTRDKVNKTTSENADAPADDRVQIAFRMPRDAYRELKRHALDEDISVNALIIRALNEMRERKGLRKFTQEQD